MGTKHEDSILQRIAIGGEVRGDRVHVFSRQELIRMARQLCQRRRIPFGPARMFTEQEEAGA